MQTIVTVGQPFLAVRRWLRGSVSRLRGAVKAPRRVRREKLEVRNEHPSRIPLLAISVCRCPHGGAAARDAFSGAQLSGSGVAGKSARKSDPENFGVQGRPLRLHGFRGRTAGAGERGERKFVLLDFRVEPVRTTAAAYGGV